MSNCQTIPAEWHTVTPVQFHEAPLWTRWVLQYSDSSTYSSTDGPWEMAPQAYVKNLEIWYGAEVPDGPFITDTARAAFYVFLPEMGYPVHTWEYMSHLRRTGKVKFGAWVSKKQFQQTRDNVKKLDTWAIYYADGSVVTGDDCLWEEAPLDGVVFVTDPIGRPVAGCDYYYWKDDRIICTHDEKRMLEAVPMIKLGVTSHVEWPPSVNKGV